jgi:hypothetical protein
MKIARLGFVAVALCAPFTVEAGEIPEGLVGTYTGSGSQTISTVDKPPCVVRTEKDITVSIGSDGAVQWTGFSSRAVRCKGDVGEPVPTRCWNRGMGSATKLNDGAYRIKTSISGKGAATALRTSYDVWDCKGARYFIGKEMGVRLPNCRLLGSESSREDENDYFSSNFACQQSKDFGELVDGMIALQKDGSLRLPVTLADRANILLTKVTSKVPAASKREQAERPVERSKASYPLSQIPFASLAGLYNAKSRLDDEERKVSWYRFRHKKVNWVGSVIGKWQLKVADGRMIVASDFYDFVVKIGDEDDLFVLLHAVGDSTGEINGGDHIEFTGILESQGIVRPGEGILATGQPYNAITIYPAVIVKANDRATGASGDVVFPALSQAEIEEKRLREIPPTSQTWEGLHDIISPDSQMNDAQKAIAVLKFNSKKIRWTGKVVWKHMDNKEPVDRLDTHVEFRMNPSLWGHFDVVVHFAEDEIERVKALKVGDDVIFAGMLEDDIDPVGFCEDRFRHEGGCRKKGHAPVQISHGVISDVGGTTATRSGVGNAFASENEPDLIPQERALLPAPPTRSQVFEKVKSLFPLINGCIDKYGVSDKDMHGQIVLGWDIRQNGQLSEITVENRKYQGTRLANCIIGVLKGVRFWRFNGEAVHIEFPFAVMGEKAEQR